MPAAERLFPIMNVESYHTYETVKAARDAGQCVLMVAIPWAMIAPHESRAQKNHRQSLAGLADRGGLAPCEAVAVLLDRKWNEVSHGAAANQILFNLWRRWRNEQPVLRPTE